MTTTDVFVPAPPPDTLRFMTWNLLNGGVDKGSEARLLDQLHLIATCAPDVLCLPESTYWNQDEMRRLRLATKTLGMKVVTLARSHIGHGKNHTALMYGPAVRLVNWTIRGKGTFHHALIRAQFRRRSAGDDPHGDFLVLATHLNPLDGSARLSEARWMTDNGGPFPGLPPRAVGLGDFNTPDREPASWDSVPTNLHSRYRLVRDDGSFGATDQRAVKMLLRSGWRDPHDVLGIPRPPTVGHYYANERVPWALDYALLVGMQPVQCFTHPWSESFKLSDHLPHFVDAVVPS